MSESEKKKIISNKNRHTSRDSTAKSLSGRAATISRHKDSADVKQPTILLKNKEVPSDEVSITKKVPKESKEAEYLMGATPTKEPPEVAPPIVKQMKKSMKLIEEGVINIDHLQDYLQENRDFIVVGVVGTQGVGKSTILNLLAETKVSEQVKEARFKSQTESMRDSYSDDSILPNKDKDEVGFIHNVETVEDIENSVNATHGINIYVSPNRVIFLDCQPILSLAVLDRLIENENKRSSLVGDFVPVENSGEIQGLQLTGFLMSVCHVLLVVQDWFFDSNVIRFVQTAEMLKPTISNPEDEYCEHSPHLIMVHNRAQMSDFTPAKFKVMQRAYELLFQKTKMHFQSNLGLASGRVLNTFNAENCGNPVNLYLIPEILPDSETVAGKVLKGHPPLEDLVKKLKANIYGATKSSLTHVQLTEKTWLVYCNKVWETVKKSPFFVEYTKLMP
ncbi:nonsense-mediated mRNA decay factor SMG9 isoform X1 [Dendroctonus ponderosae]|uniref:nonsense-mediated mRNA decay factor SMG9 isoform X1 n=1 Tax=Dendroctonus ponderosae TaxID=77166 RepID=UPI002035A2FB|nr:nonsense-mediated mRNA decay factor SMG9 isoform X1 [Dendroctonus ponderosae]XP_048521869.1 nonsense-mediated mRNA decay factor SMG9 isoform X1 [Dendroctonus ponderosae]